MIAQFSLAPVKFLAAVGSADRTWPEARERSAERRAAASEHGRAAQRAGRMQTISTVLDIGRLCERAHCHAQVAVAGERWPKPFLTHFGYKVLLTSLLRVQRSKCRRVTCCRFTQGSTEASEFPDISSNAIVECRLSL